METGLLEDWLHRAVFSSSTSLSFPSRSSSPSAHQISQAWCQVRECAQNGVLLPQHSAALSFLQVHRRTIHVAESQARLLVSILSSIASPASSEDRDHAVAAQAQSSAALLLSIWLRRGFTSVTKNSANDVLEAVVTSTIKGLEISTSSPGFVNEALLLLGSVCINPGVREEQRRVCQESIARECVRQRKCIGGSKCKEALAGIGYAMVSSSGLILKALMQGLLLLWTDEDGILDREVGPTTTIRPSLENGFLHLHLIEWYGSIVLSQEKYLASLQTVVGEIRETVLSGKAIPARYGVLLSAAGLLRCFHLRRVAKRSGTENVESSWESMVQLLNESIIKVVDDTFHLQVQEIAEAVDTGTFLGSATITTQRNFVADHVGDKHWLQAIALAASRCSGLFPSVSVLVCLTTAFLESVFPLRAYYNGTMDQLSGEDGDVLTTHVKSILFHEAGAILRVICEQYESADIKWQGLIEYLFLQFSNSIYMNHRYHHLLVDSKKQDGFVSPVFDTGNAGSLKKILEAALLSAVLFFSRASVKKIDLGDVHAKGQFAARVMHSLSCIEFIRQGQVPEYRELVQRCVSWVSTSDATCVMLVSMFPDYDEVIHPPGPLVSCYSWKKDDVQDSRVLFGFRVLPSCLHTFPSASFSKRIAPTMFLYMRHPKQALVQASHSLLVSFLSIKACEGDRDFIKEQLAVQFVGRMFEDDSALLNYDAFVTVVGAVARQLPPGSAATRECISFLSRKASEFFRLLAVRSGEEDRLEAGKKLQTLLLHLILIVDVQVLPHLLQEVARLVLGQTSPHRIHALEEAFDVLAGSDDLTRKHVLVPWLQSLSYLCSNSDEQRRSTRTNFRRRKGRSQNGLNREVGEGDGAVAFNAAMCAESEGNGISQVSKSRL